MLASLEHAPFVKGASVLGGYKDFTISGPMTHEDPLVPAADNNFWKIVEERNELKEECEKLEDEVTELVEEIKTKSTKNQDAGVEALCLKRELQRNLDFLFRLTTAIGPLTNELQGALQADNIIYNDRKAIMLDRQKNPDKTDIDQKKAEEPNLGKRMSLRPWSEDEYEEATKQHERNQVALAYLYSVDQEQFRFVADAANNRNFEMELMTAQNINNVPVNLRKFVDPWR